MKGYFEAFPYIDYDGHKMKDIFRRVKITDNIDDMFHIYEYIVEDGETPELLSYKIYNDPNKHWVLLLINEIIDPYTEWPMSIDELERYTAMKYHDINGFHHYEDDTGAVVYDNRVDQPNTYNLIYVTNIIHETAVNESKRTVKVMPLKYLSEFETTFEGKI
jgi:hypothetical protein